MKTDKRNYVTSKRKNVRDVHKQGKWEYRQKAVDEKNLWCNR